jgi:hypothetical protein
MDFITRLLIPFVVLGGCTAEVGSEPALEPAVAEPEPLASFVSCRDCDGCCYYCPMRVVDMGADLKMALGTAGLDRDRVVSICRARGVLFPDAGNCDSELGPWVQTAGHLGIIDRYEHRALTKAELAKILVAAVLIENGIRGDGFYVTDPTIADVEAYVRHVADGFRRTHGRSYWPDTPEAPTHLQPYVEYMGIKRLADGWAGRFGVNERLAKGGIAKLLLRALGWTDAEAEQVMRDRQVAAGQPYFLDTADAHGDWQKWVELMRHLDLAHGVANEGDCHRTTVVELRPWVTPDYADHVVASSFTTAAAGAALLSVSYGAGEAVLVAGGGALPAIGGGAVTGAAVGTALATGAVVVVGVIVVGVAVFVVLEATGVIDMVADPVPRPQELGVLGEGEWRTVPLPEAPPVPTPEIYGGAVATTLPTGVSESGILRISVVPKGTVQPRTCSPAVLTRLQNNVDLRCKTATYPRRCNTVLACDDMSTAIRNREACLSARMAVAVRCFGGTFDAEQGPSGEWCPDFHGSEGHWCEWLREQGGLSNCYRDACHARWTPCDLCGASAIAVPTPDPDGCGSSAGNTCFVDDESHPTYADTGRCVTGGRFTTSGAVWDCVEVSGARRWSVGTPTPP